MFPTTSSSMSPETGKSSFSQNKATAFKNKIKFRYHCRKGAIKNYFNRMEVKLFGEPAPLSLTAPPEEEEKDSQQPFVLSDLNPHDVMINRRNDNIFYQSNVDLDFIDTVFGIAPRRNSIELREVPKFVPTEKQRKKAELDKVEERKNKVLEIY